MARTDDFQRMIRDLPPTESEKAAPSLIIPGLYLTSYDFAYNLQIVHKYNIALQIDMAATEEDPYAELIDTENETILPIQDDVTFRRSLTGGINTNRFVLKRNIPAKDVAYYPISNHFAECFELMELCLSSGMNVMVNCIGGVSRSATVVCAFLMKKYAQPYHTIIQTVKSRRSIAQPNFGFVPQLLDWGGHGFM
eukprot:PhF_6_TR23297/c0_g1_i1/m.32871/K14165/K14165; atypical dual specificity phosphatase